MEMDLERVFEDRIRGLDICSITASPQNKFDKNIDLHNILEKNVECVRKKS